MLKGVFQQTDGHKELPVLTSDNTKLQNIKAMTTHRLLNSKKEKLQNHNISWTAKNYASGFVKTAGKKDIKQVVSEKPSKREASVRN